MVSPILQMENQGSRASWTAITPQLRDMAGILNLLFCSLAVMPSLASVDRIPMAYLGLKVLYCICVWGCLFFLLSYA